MIAFKNTGSVAIASAFSTVDVFLIIVPDGTCRLMTATATPRGNLSGSPCPPSCEVQGGEASPFRVEERSSLPGVAWKWLGVTRRGLGNFSLLAILGR
jgi:hypothetical protein